MREDLTPHVGEKHVDETIILDGGYWADCTFEGCDVQFRGEAPVLMGGRNVWDHCSFSGDFPPGWIAAFQRSADLEVIIRGDGRHLLD